MLLEERTWTRGHSNVGGGQGHPADVEGEPEDDLADGATVTCGDPDHLGASHCLAVGCQQGEALVDNAVGGAEGTDAAVPAPGGVTPVLDEARPDACLLGEALELFEADVADAEQTDPAAVVESFHRPPGRPVGRGQAGALAGAVQQVGVDHLGPQVPQRAAAAGPACRSAIVFAVARRGCARAGADRVGASLGRNDRGPAQRHC